MLDFPAVIDATMVNDFRNCPQKFFRKDLQHWKPKGISPHLWAGKAFAKGLEAARRGFYETNDSADVALGRGIDALIREYGTYQPPDYGTAANKSLERMLGALEFYFAEWPLGTGAQPHIMPSGRRAIEFSFAEPLPWPHPVTGDPLIYSGRADMICDFADGVYVEDDKTASQLGEQWTKQWELRSQFTGYCWAARQNRIQVNGVLVRGVSILKTKYGRADAVTYRSAWEIERWLRQLSRDIERMIVCWDDYNTDPSGTENSESFDYALDDACNNYGGCEFRDVCKSENPDEWLPVNFERRKWDPLERTETLLCSG